MYVQINRVDEATNNLTLNEREAWVCILIILNTILTCFVAYVF